MGGLHDLFFSWVGSGVFSSGWVGYGWIHRWCRYGWIGGLEEWVDFLSSSLCISYEANFIKRSVLLCVALREIKAAPVTVSLFT